MQGSCSPCASPCLTCTGYSNNNDQCGVGFESNDPTCLTCESGTYLYRQTITDIDGCCLSVCPDGYYANATLT